MKLRYNNVKWSLPLLNENNDLMNALYQFLGEDVQNFIDNIYGKIQLPVSAMEKDFKALLDRSFSLPIEYLIADENIDPQEFESEAFKKHLSFLNEKNASIVTSREELLNFVKENYPNINVIASEVLSVGQLEPDKEVEFYENLASRYDRVLLHPQYVKGVFLTQYSKFSDLSKYEVFVNWNFNEDWVLTRDELNFLSEQAGVKHFRLFGENVPMGFILDILFKYVFEPDTHTVFGLTEYLKEICFDKGCHGKNC